MQTTIPASGTQFCTFTNRFVATGSITLRKVTPGATATASFIISPDFGAPVTYAPSATTTRVARPPSRWATPKIDCTVAVAAHRASA